MNTKTCRRAVKSEDLRRGDVLDILGLGPVAIQGFRRLSDREVLAYLAWNELAVILHPGQTWRVAS